jgi:hypothetical protein
MEKIIFCANLVFSKGEKGSSDQKQPPSSIAGIDVPAPLLAVFKERPLLAGEKVEEYDAALAAFTSALRPVDIFEWAWAKDFADAYWETRRAKRIRYELLHQMQVEGIVDEIAKVINHWANMNTGDEKVNAARQKAVRDLSRLQKGPYLIEDFEEFFRKHQISANLQLAQSKSYMEALSTLENIDRMIALADGRRDRVLREIDQHRDSAVRRRLIELQTLLLQTELPEPGAISKVNGAEDAPTAH